MMVCPVLVAFSLALVVAAENCVPGPVSLPIKNVTLSTGKIQRGISLKIGNPQQEFAFLPKWDNNNTFLYGSRCDPLGLVDTTDACITLRGGVYQDGSTSQGKLPSSIQLPPDLWNPSTFSVFTETVLLDSNNTLKGFPLATPEDYESWNLQGYNPQNIIGMGSGSTLVDACRKAGIIASDSCGFYWGLDGVLDQDQTEGSFVLGGYDQAKTIGDGFTQQLSNRSDCPTGMMAYIEDITLNVDGKAVSIFPDSTGGVLNLACIVPELPVLMNMPLDPYFSNFMRETHTDIWARSLEVDFRNAVANSSTLTYTGDMTFKLNSGLEIKVPNHQLIVPLRFIIDNGDLAVNSSDPVVRINPLEGSTAGALPMLGRYFFTSAYLFINRDAGEFTIWQANSTLETNLVAVNEKNEVITTSQSCSTTTPTASAGPEPGGDGESGKDTDSVSSRSSLSSGAIAGIVIGVVAAVGIGLGALWWYFMQRRKRNAVAETEVLAVSATGKAVELDARGYHMPQEMSSAALDIQPVELPS